MKKTLLFLLSLMVGVGLFGQEKGDTGIQLKTDYPTIQDAVSGIMSILAQSAIAPEKVDKDMGMVNTTAIATKSTATIQAYFLAYAQADTIFINVTGQGYAGININGIGDNPLQVTRKGQKGSILLTQWEALEDLAIKIPHTEIRYLNPNPPTNKKRR